MFYNFATHSQGINSRQNYLDIENFRSSFKNFCFHSNKSKRQIKYRAEPPFFKTDFTSSSVMRLLSFSVVQILHFVLYLQNTKGKLIFRKTENMQL